MKGRAVVACDGHGNGCVLYYRGEVLRSEIEDAGFRELDDLWLDDAPFGIRIWEGSFVEVKDYTSEGAPDGMHFERADSEFRELTIDEWATLQLGGDPLVSVGDFEQTRGAE